jgi:hypothetical protein
MSVDHDPEVGYRIDVPWYGTHVVSSDGHEIRSALPTVSAWRWYKLLFGQVLPLAAALQGLPLFHASAVAIGDRVLGFVAGAGTGKSSVAMHLIAGGASFVTDDVMALEPVADGIRVHPGPGMASLDAAELRELSSYAAGIFGEVLGRSDKVQFAMTPVNRALPLSALFLLERSARVDRLQILRDPMEDPGRLLGSSFISSVKVPAFLARHLDVCAGMTQAGLVFDVSIPLSIGAKEVAGAIAESVAL